MIFKLFYFYIFICLSIEIELFFKALFLQYSNGDFQMISIFFLYLGRLTSSVSFPVDFFEHAQQSNDIEVTLHLFDIFIKVLIIWLIYTTYFYPFPSLVLLMNLQDTKIIYLATLTHREFMDKSESLCWDNEIKM